MIDELLAKHYGFTEDELDFIINYDISPHGRYNLKAMPNRRDIWGAEILAYYYVTWARVFPDRLDMIGLPYKKTYESALAMIKATS